MNTREFSLGHHTDIAHDGRAQFDRVNHYHKSQGFPISSLGTWCGYHLFIEEDGKLIQARSLDERGAHAVNSGSAKDLSEGGYNTINYRGIGICLAGNFSVHPPTLAQVVTLHDVVWDLTQKYGSRFLLHREVKATSCPGTDLRALIDAQHINWLKQDLTTKQNALRWATGLRRTLLERSIARILRVLHPLP